MVGTSEAEHSSRPPEWAVRGRHRSTLPAVSSAKSLAPTNYFFLSLQSDDVCPALVKNILISFFRKMWLVADVSHSQEGRIAVVTDVERGMRWTCRCCSG